MKLFRAIFNNIFAKILSIIIALGIWIYVGAGFAQTGEFPGKIPLEFKNVPQGLMPVASTDSVSIKIIAAADLWKNLNSDSFKISIDLSSYVEGTYDIPLKVSVNVPDVQVVEVNPEKVIVRLEKITEKEIPVVLQAEGKSADGYVIGSWKLKPDRVKISGASSVVSKILQATAKIMLSGEKDNLQRIVKLVALDQAGNEIKNLTFSPEEVEAQVPIVQASSAKTVGIKVITTGQPANGFWVSGIETVPSQIAVTASSSLINNINFIETKEVNVNGLSEEKDFTTTLNPAVGVIVLDNVPVIKVKITVSPISSTRQMQIGFNWQNINSNLKVSSVEPSMVTLVLTGSTGDLARLNAKDVSLNIDLNSFSSPGTYSVDISRNNVVLPTGISFSSVVPSAINVRLENN